MFPSYPDIDEEKFKEIIVCCERQHQKISDQRVVIADQGRELTHVKAQLAEAEERLRVEGGLRSSLEVLQRMANGVDPFDKGRFAAAVAALPHETPKLSATQNLNHNVQVNLAERLDQMKLARQRADALAQERGLRVIEGESA